MNKLVFQSLFDNHGSFFFFKKKTIAHIVCTSNSQVLLSRNQKNGDRQFQLD